MLYPHPSPGGWSSKTKHKHRIRHPFDANLGASSSSDTTSSSSVSTSRSSLSTDSGQRWLQFSLELSSGSDADAVNQAVGASVSSAPNSPDAQEMETTPAVGAETEQEGSEKEGSSVSQDEGAVGGLDPEAINSLAALAESPLPRPRRNRSLSEGNAVLSQPVPGSHGRPKFSYEWPEA